MCGITKQALRLSKTASLDPHTGLTAGSQNSGVRDSSRQRDIGHSLLMLLDRDSIPRGKNPLPVKPDRFFNRLSRKQLMTDLFRPIAGKFQMRHPFRISFPRAAGVHASLTTWSDDSYRQNDSQRTDHAGVGRLTGAIFGASGPGFAR
jgi:hypothetical protein